MCLHAQSTVLCPRDLVYRALIHSLCVLITELDVIGDKSKEF